MHSVSQNPEDPSALDFEGTPAELAELFDDTMGDDSVATYVEVLGLAVEHVHHGAQHNGQPAYGFSLGDHSLPNRNIGRLTLIDSEEWDVLIPVWTVHYYTEQAAAEHLATLNRRATLPKISTISLDLSTESHEDEEELVAGWAAQYGVSMWHSGETAGNGLPVYMVSGYTDRIEKFLRGAYDFDDEAVGEALTANL